MGANKRVDIKTGFICNNNCRFCVQADNKFKGNRSFEDIKKDLIDSRKRCEGVVLTGGEVTIRKDFFDIVRLAKEIGYKTIQIQTNARMFASLDFCKKTIEAGATEFSPALHSYCAEQHDFLTKSPGSFNQTIKGIKNLKSLRAYVLTNTVVVKSNYRNCPEIARLLVNLGVDQFQFAFVHPMGNAWKNFDNIVPCISLAAPYIHRGLQIGIDAGKRVMAEAMPYCLMEGYEDYISEKVIPETEIRGKEFQNTDDFTRQRRVYGKAKFSQCRTCRYDDVCEGPWKEYAGKKGNEEFKAVIDVKMNCKEISKKFNEYNFHSSKKNVWRKLSDQTKYRGLLNTKKCPKLAGFKALVDDFKKNGNVLSRSLNIIVTYQCNNNCSFCFQKGVKEHLDKSNELQSMAPDDLILLLNYLYKNQIPLQITGGEPLLYPHFDLLLDCLEKKKTVANLITSFTTRLEEKNVKRISNTFNNIMINTNPAFKNKYNFEMVKNNLSMIDCSNVKLSYTITKINTNFKPLISLAKRFNIGEIRLDFARCGYLRKNSYFNLNKFMKQKDLQDKFLKEIVDLSKHFKITWDCMFPKCLMEKIIKLEKEGRENIFFSHVCQSPISINPDLTIGLCTNPNVLKLKITDFSNPRVFLKIKSYIQYINSFKKRYITEKCVSCKDQIADRCFGNCPNYPNPIDK